ncbi:MAG: outer membrane beta-barrel protein, partial [Bacteroidia bacterium]|nr:outer membrane beta-barrel protein [Bacteroidia bacterium]
YNGPSLIPQRTIYPNYSLDLALRKDFLKNKFSIAVNLSDAFNNRRFKIKSSDINFISDSYRKRESRILNFALTWKFGKSFSVSEKKTKPVPLERSGEEMSF